MRSSLAGLCLLIATLPASAQVAPPATTPTQAAQPKAAAPAASPVTSAPATTAPAAKTPAATTPGTKTPAAATPAAKVVPKAVLPSKPTEVVDAELSGITTSQLTDALFARLRIQRTAPPREWFLRTSYQFTSQDTVSGRNIITTKTTTKQLDTEFRRNGGKNYKFLAGALNIRGRTPSNKTYPGRSGYYFAYGGRGWRLGPKLETGIGMGILHNYDDGSRTQPAVAMNVRGQLPISTRLTFDTLILAIRPLESHFKLDSEAALQYRLMQGLFLRLGYATTNLVKPTLTNGDWNNTLRLSLLLRRTR